MPTLVQFIGGPFAGQAEVRDDSQADPLRGSGALMAEMAYRDYSAHPPAAGAAQWMLCRVHSGKAAGSHFYQIISGSLKAGRLELVCQYGGREYPSER
jgi:hypothetical protein